MPRRRNENRRRRFSYVVGRRGNVLRKMELYTGQNWITQMAKTVATSVEEFREKFPDREIRGIPTEPAEPPAPTVDIAGLSGAALKNRLSGVDSMDALSAALDDANTEAQKNAVKQRMAEVFRATVNPEPETEDEDTPEDEEES